LPTRNDFFVRLTVSVVEAPKVTQISIVNLNERFSVTELQVTACVFGSISAFLVIAEGLTVCPFSGVFLYELSL